MLQHLLPRRALTEAVGRLAAAKAGAATTAAIRWFISRYGVNMAEAQWSDPGAYASFNDFFTRALRAGARPLARSPLVCPVDGAISQFGDIEGDQILQAKGHRYTVTALLGGDEALARPFMGGRFATLYLSPRDYHRIHMPCAGRLRCMVHVPGDLYSVNPATAQALPGLFARNERVVCLFDAVDADVRGPWALVLVGATVVGSMATAWHGVVNPPRPAVPRRWDYEGQDVRLSQGEEMGRFLLGSTVVLLFAAPPAGSTPRWQFNPGWAPGGAVRMGEVMAQAVESH